MDFTERKKYKSINGLASEEILWGCGFKKQLRILVLHIVHAECVQIMPTTCVSQGTEQPIASLIYKTNPYQIRQGDKSSPSIPRFRVNYMDILLTCQLACSFQDGVTPIECIVMAVTAGQNFDQLFSVF